MPSNQRNKRFDWEKWSSFFRVPYRQHPAMGEQVADNVKLNHQQKQWQLIQWNYKTQQVDDGEREGTYEEFHLW